MSYASLSIDITAKLASLEADMGKATQLIRRQAEQMDKAFAGVNRTVAAMGATIATGFASAGVAGLSAFISRTIDGVDALNDAKDATGATIEQLSALEDVARRNGGTLDDVTGILVKFNGALKEADGKNGVSQALQALGLNAKELRDLDPAEALQRTAVALQGFADDGNKARIVQELFGKSIREAAPFLNDLAEAGRLHASVTAEQAREAEKFNKALAAFRAHSEDAHRAMVSELLPAINDFITRMNVGTEATGSFFKGLSSALSGGNAAKNLQDVQKEIAQIQQAMNAAPGAIGWLDNWARDKNAARLKDLEAAQRYYSRLVGMQNDAAGQSNTAELARRGRYTPPPGLPDIAGLGGAGAAAKVKAPDLTISQPLRDALDAINSTDEAKVQRLRDELLQLVYLKEHGSEDPYLSDAIQNTTEKLEKLSPAFQEAAAAKAKLNSFLENTPTMQLEKARQDMMYLAERFEAGKLSAVEFAEAAQTRLGIQVPEALQELSSAADEAARNIQDALGQTVYDTMKGNTDNILQLWGDMLLKMVAQAVSVDLGKFLLGDTFGQKGGSLGGLLGDALGAIFGTGKANGGPVGAGMIYPVLENGTPEVYNAGGRSYLLTNRSSGGVTPLGAGGAGGGGVTNVYNVAAGVSRAEVLQILQQYGRAQQASNTARMQATGG